ncbi:ABC transporter permease, partial [Slackia piriformis]|nr:nitrate ABC transporter permease [Slackia piriformis]
MGATKLDRRLKKWAQRFWPLAFWLFVWHMASVVIGHDILLVSPLDAGKRLIELAGNGEFWGSVGLSLSRIATGFASALAAGIVLAAASARLPFMRHLLAPLVVTIKSVPVASFVILILIWVSSEHLSVAISFLMAFPIVYTTML